MANQENIENLEFTTFIGLNDSRVIFSLKLENKLKLVEISSLFLPGIFFFKFSIFLMLSLDLTGFIIIYLLSSENISRQTYTFQWYLYYEAGVPIKPQYMIGICGIILKNNFLKWYRLLQ